MKARRQQRLYGGPINSGAVVFPFRQQVCALNSTFTLRNSTSEGRGIDGALLEIRSAAVLPTLR